MNVEVTLLVLTNDGEVLVDVGPEGTDPWSLPMKDFHGGRLDLLAAHLLKEATDLEARVDGVGWVPLTPCLPIATEDAGGGWTMHLPYLATVQREYLYPLDSGSRLVGLVEAINRKEWYHQENEVLAMVCRRMGVGR